MSVYYDLLDGSMKHAYSSMHHRAGTTTVQALASLFASEIQEMIGAESAMQLAMDRSCAHDRVASVAWAEWWRLSGGVMPGDEIIIGGLRALVRDVRRCRGYNECACHGAAIDCVNLYVSYRTKRGWSAKTDYDLKSMRLAVIQRAN